MAPADSLSIEDSEWDREIRAKASKKREKVLALEKAAPPKGPPPRAEPKPGEYHVLMLGETGAGKSTLINYMTNYFNDGSLDELKVSIPTRFLASTEGCVQSEKDLTNGSVSKTSDCNIYNFNKGRSQFRFIDLPGLCDTAGTTKDDENISKIMMAAEAAGSLTAIVIVINGSVARQTVNMQNTLTLLRGSVPDVLMKNLVVVLTNCTCSSFNFELSSLAPGIVSDEHVFFMNNSAFSQAPTRSGKLAERVEDELQGQWAKSMDEIENLLGCICGLGDAATGAFGSMLTTRNDIKARLHLILLEVQKVQNLQDKLESSHKAQKGVIDDIRKYANFKQNKGVDSFEMRDSEYHSTFCTKHTDRVRHARCGLQETTTVGDNIFVNCACMRGGGNCVICECDHTTHYHTKKELVKVQLTVEEILHDVKAHFDQANGRQADLKKSISSLQNDLRALEAALKDKEKQIKQCCLDMQKVCRNFNFVDHLNGSINAMERAARSLTNSTARQQANDMINSIKLFIDRLSQGQSDAQGDGSGSIAQRCKSFFRA